jgi:glycosyltransferase involved in cell wall biosynthesis
VTAGLRGADLVIAPSETMLHAVERFYGPLLRTRVIPNGRDATLYRCGHKDGLILSAGRLWDEAKNVSALERIAGELRWPVCIAGEAIGPDGNAAPRCAGGGARLLGKLDARALAAWFARADIYCLPARYEPFGLSALEAALSGCALVLGDIPSLREVWRDAAAFVDPDDPPALRDRLRELIEWPWRRRRLAGRAIGRAGAYALARLGDGYLSAYQQTLRHRRAIEISVAAAPADVSMTSPSARGAACGS